MPIPRQNKPKHSDSAVGCNEKEETVALESGHDFLQQQHEQQQQRRDAAAASTTATTDMTLTTVSTSARTCFHCGKPGHMALHCHDRLAQHEQSQEGKTAFQSFVAGGSKQDRMSDRRRYSLHHFYKLRAWIRQRQQQQQQQQSNGDHDSHADRVIDPISLAFEALSANGHTDANGKNDCRCLRKNIFHSYRELFDQTIQQLEMRYKAYTLRNIDRACCWQSILTQAVKDGTPAIFSDPNALRTYTLEKLTPRCRQLHHLILDHNNPFAKSIRALLLPPNPAATRRTSGDTATNPTTHESRPIVSVCSIGGGPGYDHIAVCMVADFLHHLASSDKSEDHSYQHVAARIRTRVFDLYDESWAPIADELMECWNTVASAATAASSSLAGHRKAPSQVTMHHADLRMPLSAPSNRDLEDAIPNADLIVFQFVLHENAAFLQLLPSSAKGPQHHDDGDEAKDTAIAQDETSILMPTTELLLLCLDDNDDNNNTVNRKNDGANAVVDMLRCAKVGALIVCTDSVHTMWPVLQATAALYGWVSMCNAQRHHNIVMGPNSFLLMERTNLGN